MKTGDGKSNRYGCAWYGSDETLGQAENLKPYFLKPRADFPARVAINDVNVQDNFQTR
jgi:hypothetical protein